MERLKRADDPYRLGWRFWSRHVLTSAMAAVALSALTHLFKEPASWTQFLVWFLVGALMFLGPALNRHYHRP